MTINTGGGGHGVPADPCPIYTNTLQAEIGRIITSEALNAEFTAIEEAMGCIEGLILANKQIESTVHTYGSVSTTMTVIPSNGPTQKMMLVGDVDIYIANPGVNDSNIITLLLGDGGSGRFRFLTGAVWCSDSEGSTMDGKPWDNNGAGGDYGAVVWLIYDGDGWFVLCFSRNDVDPDATADPTDLINWK